MTTQAQYDDLTAQAVGYWPCNEGTGDVIANVNGEECQGIRDTTSGLWDNDGIEGSGIKSPKDIFGPASFHMTNGTAVDFPTGNFSGSFWFKKREMSGVSAWPMWHMGGIGGFHGYLFGIYSDGTPKAYLGYASYPGCYKELSGSATVDDGIWHHLAYTVNRAGYLSIYVDGGLDAYLDISDFSYDITNSDDLFVYAQGFERQSPQDAFVDEFCMFDRVLTPEEVVILASLPISPPTLTESTPTWFYFEYDDRRIGKSIPANLKTGRLDFGLEMTHKRFQSIDVTADATGSLLRADLSLNGNTDRLGTTINLGLGRVSEDAAGNNWLVWTRGNWDDSKWAELQTKTYQAHKRFPVHAKGVDAQLEISSTHIQDTQLSGIDLFIIPIGGAY